MVTELCPVFTETAAENFYFRAASAHYLGQRLEVPDGIGGYVDLTKLFEQYRMLAVLANEPNQPEVDHGNI